MLDRSKQLDAFVRNTIWASWNRSRLAMDASSRSYMRLTDGVQSVIIMDAPPETGEDTAPFIKIANHLITCGLAAPAILAQEMTQGFLVLDDLGSDDFATILRTNPLAERELYTAATDVLIHLRKQESPPLIQMTPDVAGQMVRIAAEHYVASPALADDLAGEVKKAVTSLCGPANVLALRDYHAENLIWRIEKSELSRVGLLDFQDAFIAPDGYDLASLLRDARRDVSKECADQVMAYFAQETGTPLNAVQDAVACLSVQRNLRILGVFARLIKVQGKTRYAAMLPRVWGHVMKDVQHPALGKLHSLISKGIPNPTDPSIAKWAR